MDQNLKTVIFDLDGTIYQNVSFHRTYLRYLLEGTPWAKWETAFVDFVDDVFAGNKLAMNHYYQIVQVQVATPREFFAVLEQCICPSISYEQALIRSDLIYLGDAWAVVTFIGEMLGLIGDRRGDYIYRRVRSHMEQQGMEGNPRLKAAIAELSHQCKVILMSNSYEATALEFLRQLGYEGIFPHLCSSANKPLDMIAHLERWDPQIFAESATVLSIGDHAYNDLMPIQQKGGGTVWINPFQNIARPECDVELASLDELAGFLDNITYNLKTG